MAMNNPVHPGEILREDVLADLGLSVSEPLDDDVFQPSIPQ